MSWLLKDGKAHPLAKFQRLIEFLDGQRIVDASSEADDVIKIYQLTFPLRFFEIPKIKAN